MVILYFLMEHLKKIEVVREIKGDYPLNRTDMNCTTLTWNLYAITINATRCWHHTKSWRAASTFSQNPTIDLILVPFFIFYFEVGKLNFDSFSTSFIDYDSFCSLWFYRIWKWCWLLDQTWIYKVFYIFVLFFHIFRIMIEIVEWFCVNIFSSKAQCSCLCRKAVSFHIQNTNTCEAIFSLCLWVSIFSFPFLAVTVDTYYTKVFYLFCFCRRPLSDVTISHIMPLM